MMFSLYKGLMKEHARGLAEDKETDFASYQEKLKNVIGKRSTKTEKINED